MQTWMVWTVMPITPISLRQFVQDLAGAWIAGAEDEEAVFTEGDACVYVSSSDASDEQVPPEDVEYATAQLGTRPASILSLDIGHGSGSLRLAAEVAKRAVEKWGGFLDYNEPLPALPPRDP